MKRHAPRLAPVPRFSGQRVALAVGMPAELMPHWMLGEGDITIEAIPYVLIHAAMASAPLVSHVVTPLMTAQFDAQDLAQELAMLRFRGHLIVLPPRDPRLPRPEIVRHELMATCPRMAVTILDPVVH